MKQTKYWKVNINEQRINKQLTEAATLLLRGETVAFPTETVYGLGADATNEKAVKKIFQAKGRPQDNPLIAHVATKQQLVDIVDKYNEYVDKLIEAFSPGPITYILPSNGTCAANVTAGLSSIGVRIPDHPIALKLLQIANIPVAAPSANLSGKPSPSKANHVWEDLQGKIAGLVDAGPTGVGVESTVIDCTGPIPVILRPGGISKSEIEAVIGPVQMDPSLHNDSEKPKAPGMKYTHYSPEVPLWLVDGPVDKLQQIVCEVREQGKRVGVLLQNKYLEQIEADAYFSLGENMSEVAMNLYEGLRHFKKENIDLIVCETFPEIGIGQAVMNRLRKAASKII